MAIGGSVVETLVKPGGLLVRSCNPTQFPKSTSTLTNLNRSVIPNASNYSKCSILSKVDSFRTFTPIVFLLSISIFPKK